MVLSPSLLPPDQIVRLTRRLDPDVRRLFGSQVSLQIFNFTHEEFAWGRTSPNHVVGGVQREGVTPEGERMPAIRQNNPWPAVQQHLQVTHESLFQALHYAGIDNLRGAGAQAHHAMENGLKAYLSALGVRYDRTHELQKLVQQIPSGETTVLFPPTSWLESLSLFREQSPYDVKRRPPVSAEEAVATAQDLCRRIAHRALHLCQKSPAQVSYEHMSHAAADVGRPLGGIEDADLQAFNRYQVLAEAQAQALAEVQAQALIDLAHLIGTPDQVAKL